MAQGAVGWDPLVRPAGPCITRTTVQREVDFGLPRTLSISV